jgi:hypothetical protein
VRFSGPFVHYCEGKDYLSQPGGQAQNRRDGRSPNNWTNYGSVFTATNTIWRTTNYWDVDNWSELFFRLQVVP